MRDHSLNVSSLTGLGENNRQGFCHKIEEYGRQRPAALPFCFGRIAPFPHLIDIVVWPPLTSCEMRWITPGLKPLQCNTSITKSQVTRSYIFQSIILARCPWLLGFQLMHNLMECQHLMEDESTFDKCCLIQTDNSIGNSVKLDCKGFGNTFEDDVDQCNWPKLQDHVGGMSGNTPKFILATLILPRMTSFRICRTMCFTSGQ